MRRVRIFFFIFLLTSLTGCGTSGGFQRNYIISQEQNLQENKAQEQGDELLQVE